MIRILCGQRIRNGSLAPGTAGCLLDFEDSPQRVLLLTAGHAVIATSSRQNDPVEAIDAAGQTFGTLRTWSSLDGATTVDAALIWIEPAMASADLVGLGAPPSGIGGSVKVGDTLRLVAGSGEARTTTVTGLNQSIPMSVPGWGLTDFAYRGQIRCQPSVSLPGDSGAVMLDADNRVVGMLVGGSSAVGDVVTPIDAIFNHPGWRGVPRLLDHLPNSAASPVGSISAPPPPVDLLAAPPAAHVDYLERLPRPAKQGVNQGLTSPSSSFMVGLLGLPRKRLTASCQSPDDAAFQKLIETRQVGPIRVTGLKATLDSLDEVLAQVKSELPDLHSMIGTQGMLCCRLKKIKGKVIDDPSNHSWGTAVDLMLGGVMDLQGDDLVQRGLLVLSRYFNAHGWFWGATFPTEDGMHFEVSREQLARWRDMGMV